ncbi:4-hydroxy-3-methylbut-2-enyl diphosphate reductase [Amycolatopsis aidingensis]|uniref:4-hydroxy-3-methylbut-2-enyl diphosphate reductase n=1 Tax=Amycolatopsis aidingensis TaxID=2842453 RepID=UPI001C0AA9FB|nr:4-hydroxy-3-methylbut-2-enyl diphosphate reductase [Amycolatopsis aidingensis]
MGDIACPAADLLDGEIRRLGMATIRGAVSADAADRGPAGQTVLTTQLREGGRVVGLGVAAAGREGGVAARAALASWVAVTGARRILLAAPRSFCAGVERAIDVVKKLLDQRRPPIYVRKQIVHNRHVVADLEARGVVFVDELDAVPDAATVVFSAHGVSPAVRAEAARRRMEVVDAACPLVSKVHTEARRFAARGDTVVLVGHAGHEEVEGTLGEAPEQMVLVQDVAEVAALVVPDPERVSYLTQTTLAVDETTEIIDALHARFPALRGPASDDICYATTNRQDALMTIADESDLVLVVGSVNSSNSQRLVELTRRHGTSAYLIDAPGDIRPEWLNQVSVVGLTAGASAPPGLVDSVIDALSGLGPVTVSERETTREDIHFALPSPVRHS